MQFQYFHKKIFIDIYQKSTKNILENQGKGKISPIIKW